MRLTVLTFTAGSVLRHMSGCKILRSHWTNLRKKSRKFLRLI